MSGGPLTLALGAALPVLVALALAAFVRRRRRVAARLGDRPLLAALAGEDLVAVPWGRVLPVLLAALSLGAALADPRWGEAAETGETRGGTVVLVIDASGSMLTADLPPDRLARAREAARELAASLPGAPVAVVAFAGRAYALVPPTVDRGALDLYLDALDPAMVTQSGSSLAAAVRQGVGLLAAGEDDLGSGALVLISDGDALDEPGRVEEAVGLARRAGVPIHALGAATPRGGPVPDVDLATGESLGFKREAGGEIAVSRLGEALLREVAGGTGGEYASLADAGAVERVAAALRERGGEGPGGRGGAPPRFAWFAFAALLLLVAEMGSGARRRDG